MANKPYPIFTTCLFNNFPYPSAPAPYRSPPSTAATTTDAANAALAANEANEANAALAANAAARPWQT